MIGRTIKMSTTGIRTFDHSLNTAREWLSDVKEELNITDEQQAFLVTRSVLHTLRDRLPVQEAADFAAQLPMLLQGLYYHEWSPTGKPEKIRHKDDFLAAVGERLLGKYSPQEAVEGVFKVLAQRIGEGEIEDVKGNLPKEIQELWPK